MASASAEAEAYNEMIEFRWWAPSRLVTWKRRGWDWEDRAGDDIWTVYELTTSLELAKESAAMRHCVSTYTYRCAQGRSSIFSVLVNGERRFTVEIDPINRRVVQCHGKCNRACDAEELAFVRRWLASVADHVYVPDRP